MVLRGKKRTLAKEVPAQKKIKEEAYDLSLPKVVVGLDFGTTYSGFAFIHRSDPEDVHIFTDWPGAPRAYCKGQTGLFYVPEICFKLEDWGWNATIKYAKACKAFRLDWAKDHAEEPAPGEIDAKVGMVALNFKILLAEEGQGPTRFSDEKLVVDYLGSIYQFICGHLKDKYGKGFSTREVQWCLTVPAIWSDRAKQKMQVFAEKAGLVRGRFCGSLEASMFPVRIILEPEAASFSCQRQLQGVLSFSGGDKFIVADLGGGTIDVIVHEKLNALDKIDKVHEVSANSGVLGGGIFVDSNFLAYLRDKIGCFEVVFRLQEPDVFQKIMDWWLGPQGKATFDGTGSKFLEVPYRLSKAWKKHDTEQLGLSELNDDYYAEIEISNVKMRAMFDTEVNKAIKLIQERLSAVRNIKYIFLVGGFSENPYVMKRIKDRFSSTVTDVFSPPNPGAAVCRGAVALGVGAGVVMSRVSKKWYGIHIDRLCNGTQTKYSYTDENGDLRCTNLFSRYIKKDQSVFDKESINSFLSPLNKQQEIATISIFSSSSDIEPTYTTDDGCTELHRYDFDINEDLHLGTNRSIEVTMCFGKSCIEVFARRVNFGKNREPEKLYSVEFDASESFINVC